jgi:hypothetical protein
MPQMVSHFLGARTKVQQRKGGETWRPTRYERAVGLMPVHEAGRHDPAGRSQL